MKFLTPFFLTSLVVGQLLADDDTYLLSTPNMVEWTPPVEKIIELPNLKVKKAHVIQQGGRHVCLEECEAPVEKPKRVVKKIDSSQVVYDPSGGDEDYVPSKMVFISATVYMEGDKPYSHIRLQCEQEKIEVWSSMNFMKMAGVVHYVAHGIEYYNLVGHGFEHSMSASEAGCPVDRNKLNQEKSRFLVIGDRDEESQALEAMRGLHSIYNKEHEALKAAYKVRVANQEKSNAWHAANPPVPKDITIRFWKREPNQEEK